MTLKDVFQRAPVKLLGLFIRHGRDIGEQYIAGDRPNKTWVDFSNSFFDGLFRALVFAFDDLAPYPFDIHVWQIPGAPASHGR